MLPANPLLQLTPARARKALQRIGDAIWLPPQALTVEYAGCSREHVSLAVARKRTRETVTSSFCWGQLEDQAWFRIVIPAELADGSQHLEWKEQGESTAYVDGVPYAGLDIGHHHCPIPSGCREIWMEVMALESGIWLRDQTQRPALTADGCRFEGAFARRRDPLAWEVFHSFDVLLDLLQSEHGRNPSQRTPFGREIGYISALEDVTPLYRRLLRLIERAVCAYETGGLPACRESLTAAYAALKGRNDLVRCRLTGHAHIDLVWLWTEKAAEFKAVHTFATANRLMGQYPEFRFGYSQPASYRAVGRRAPELLEAVRGRIEAGQWEAVGAAEVESDTLIACGEALARSLIVGQDGFRDLQGKESEVLWLPDVFGYSACLPQILAQTGVKYFFTTKLHWGSLTLFPYSSFLWQGSDGSEILAHVSQGMGYNMNVRASEIRSAANEYRQSDVHEEMLMACGYGDGGGGVTEAMCERARRLEDLAGTPACAWGRIDDYFKGLEPVRADLPAYQGELYLQYHRGVLTTHGNLKAAFRATERALQIWEAAHCVSGRGEIDIEAWRRMIFAQFHDYIPGSSVPEVYEEAIPELETLAARALAAARTALASTESQESALFNPLLIARSVTHAGKIYQLPPLAGIPLAQLSPLDAPAVRAQPDRLANDRLEARFDAAGRITDLRIDGTPMALHQPLGQLALYPDQPHFFEAWDIDRSSLAQPSYPSGGRYLDHHEGGDGAYLRFETPVTAQSRIRTTYRLAPGSPVLEVDYEIHWDETEHLLKVLFPTAYNGSHARFGDPFGSTLRSQQPGKPYDEAQWESAGNRWALVADDGEQEGLFVVTEAKYGWSCRSGTLGLSLLRSAKLPDNPNAAAQPPRERQRAYSDLGVHHIRIALGRFDPAATREETPAAWADRLFTPAIPYHGSAQTCGLINIEGGPSLHPSWAKPEADGEWTLRLHETLGRRGQLRLRLAEGYRATAVQLDGKPSQTTNGNCSYAFTPYQILSFRISAED